MLNVMYLLAPELAAFMFAKLIGNISMLPFTLMLVCFSVFKAVGSSSVRTYSSLRLNQLLLASAGFLYEMGTVISIHTQSTTEISALLLMLVAIVAGTAAVWLTGHLDEHLTNSQAVEKLLLLCGAGAVLLALVFRFFGRSINGSYNWMRFFGVSVQLSELYKPLLAIVFGIIITRRIEKIEQFYLFAGLLSFLMTVLLREKGTAMVFVVATLALGLVFSRHEEIEHKTNIFSMIRSVVRNVGVPLVGSIAVVFAFVTTYMVTEYKVKNDPEIVYDSKLNVYKTENEDSEKAIYLYNRIHSDSEQIRAARQALKDAHFIQLQPRYKAFHNAVTTELISDYNFVSMSTAYGYAIPCAAAAVFTAALLIAVFKLRKIRTVSGRAAQCSIVLLLAEMLFHIGGLFFLPFTGITFPFSSFGGSALVCGAMLLGIIFGAVAFFSTDFLAGVL